ncbi:MAG TPA: HPF/RaiA family ribosome-associated protein, partial [Polyangiaceae bacterium]
MNISITFRHMDSSDAVRKYAEGKLSKLQKFLRRPMTAKVTLSIDRLKHSAEARISSGGEHLEAHERS